MVSKSMQKPIPGEAYGITDGGPPTDYTEEQLSHVTDMLYSASLVGLENVVFRALPYNLKMDWNWSKWTYRGSK